MNNSLIAINPYPSFKKKFQDPYDVKHSAGTTKFTYFWKVISSTYKELAN